MSIQATTRVKIMKSMLEEGKTLEIGIANHQIKEGERITLDCVEEYNPDLLCNLDTEAIPLDDETVNVVIAGEVLEHLMNPYNVVREFYRVLKPNGILIISSPNICSLVNRINMLRGRLPSYCAEAFDDVSPERHIIDFNVESLKDILDKANFKIEKITSNGLISKGKLITKLIPASMGETLIIKSRKLKWNI